MWLFGVPVAELAAPEPGSPKSQLVPAIDPSGSLEVEVTVAVRFVEVEVNDAVGGMFGGGSVTVTGSSWRC